MISGTIIGEISVAMIAPLKGTWLWLKPTAANVPKNTAMTVAKGAMMSEFLKGRVQSELVTKST